MAQFFKINPLSNNVNGTSLVNFSDATLIQFNNDAVSCNIFYGDIGNPTQGIMKLDTSSASLRGTPLMGAVQQTIEASPSARIITFPSQVSTIEYLGN